MGLRDEIQSELSEAFDDDLEDVVVDIKLIKQELVGEYDVDSGKREVFAASYGSRGIFSAYPSNKIDGVNILVEDEKLTIIASEIEATPEADDFITIDSGVKYRVVKSNSVMGGGTIPITYIVQVRKNV